MVPVYVKTGAESGKTPCKIWSSLIYSKLKKIKLFIQKNQQSSVIAGMMKRATHLTSRRQIVDIKPLSIYPVPSSNTSLAERERRNVGSRSRLKHRSEFPGRG